MSALLKLYGLGARDFLVCFRFGCTESILIVGRKVCELQLTTTLNRIQVTRKQQHVTIPVSVSFETFSTKSLSKLRVDRKSVSVSSKSRRIRASVISYAPNKYV